MGAAQPPAARRTNVGAAIDASAAAGRSVTLGASGRADAGSIRAPTLDVHDARSADGQRRARGAARPGRRGVARRLRRAAAELRRALRKPRRVPRQSDLASRVGVHGRRRRDDVAPLRPRCAFTLEAAALRDVGGGSDHVRHTRARTAARRRRTSARRASTASKRELRVPGTRASRRASRTPRSRPRTAPRAAPPFRASASDRPFPGGRRTTSSPISRGSAARFDSATGSTSSRASAPISRGSVACPTARCTPPARGSTSPARRAHGRRSTSATSSTSVSPSTPAWSAPSAPPSVTCSTTRSRADAFSSVHAS